MSRSKVTECRSLQDLGLKYKYHNDKLKATFTHVARRLDKEKCIQSIKAFQKKINSHSKDTGYKLLYGIKEGAPYFKISPQNNVDIPELVKHICYNLSKKIKVKIEHKMCEWNPPTRRCRIVE